jgi:hypothetical protein
MGGRGRGGASSHLQACSGDGSGCGAKFKPSAGVALTGTHAHAHTPQGVQGAAHGGALDGVGDGAAAASTAQRPRPPRGTGPFFRGLRCTCEHLVVRMRVVALPPMRGSGGGSSSV